MAFRITDIGVQPIHYLNTLGMSEGFDTVTMNNYPIRIVAGSCNFPYHMDSIPYDSELISTLYSTIENPADGFSLSNSRVDSLLEYSKYIRGTMYLRIFMSQGSFRSRYALATESSDSVFIYLMSEPLFDYEEDAIMFKLHILDEFG